MPVRHHTGLGWAGILLAFKRSALECLGWKTSWGHCLVMFACTQTSSVDIRKWLAVPGVSGPPPCHPANKAWYDQNQDETDKTNTSTHFKEPNLPKNLRTKKNIHQKPPCATPNPKASSANPRMFPFRTQTNPKLNQTPNPTKPPTCPPKHRRHVQGLSTGQLLHRNPFVEFVVGRVPGVLTKRPSGQAVRLVVLDPEEALEVGGMSADGGGGPCFILFLTKRAKRNPKEL